MLGVPDAACECAAMQGEFTFAHEGVLGTSMELIVNAPRAGDAVECERRVLAEIERLRGILSTYDSASEIRRVMAVGAVESAELAEVLDAYSRWSARTSGAIELNMAGVIDCWKRGERLSAPAQRDGRQRGDDGFRDQRR